MRDQRLEHGPAPVPIHVVAGRPVEVEEALDIFLLANEFQPNLISFSNAALLQVEMGDNAGAMATYQAALAADILMQTPSRCGP